MRSVILTAYIGLVYIELAHAANDQEYYRQSAQDPCDGYAGCKARDDEQDRADDIGNDG